MRPKVFITRKLPRAALARLGEVCDYEIGTERGTLGRAALLKGVRGAAGLICLLSDQIDQEVLAAGDELRIVANAAAGYNNIDVTTARVRGVFVTNAPDVGTEATAEVTLALLLAVARRLVEADAYVRAGSFTEWDWEAFAGCSLSGKMLGVIGYGRIGRAVARRAAAFGMQVIYCRRDEIAFRDDPAPASLRLTGATQRRAMDAGVITPTVGLRQDGLSARRAGFYELLAESDFITLHVPLAAATHHLIDRGAFARMKTTAYLINTARGAVVDEAALIEALGTGHLAGAGLDVYEHEPHIAPELRSLKNVVLLPHLGGATRETLLAMSLLAVENVLDVLAGQAPRNAV